MTKFPRLSSAGLRGARQIGREQGKLTEKKMDQKEVEARIQGLAPEQAKAVVCALIGHSKIVHTCMGYIHCARCDAQIGDSLGGAGSTADNVIVGHACPKCKENFAKCDWRDTFMAPDPLDEKVVEEMADAKRSLDEFVAERATR